MLQLNILSNRYQLLIALSILVIIIATTFISILIPVMILVLILIYLIIKDFRFGTILIILFAFSSVAGQKLFEAYHMFILLTALTIFSLSLAFLKHRITLKGVREFNLLLIIFGIWAFLSGVIAIDHKYWLQNIEWMLRAFILFYLIYNSFSTKEEVFLIFKVIILSIFISSFSSFFASFGGLGISFKNMLPLFLHRFSGSVFDPNYFSMTVVASIPLAITLIIKERYPFLKMLWIFSILFLIFSIILSQSRTGLFSVTVVFLYTVFFLLQRKRKEVFFIAVPLVIIIIAIPSVFWYRLFLFWQSVSTNIKADYSTVHRFLLLSSAFDVFIKNPIFGVGLGNFEAIAARYTQYPMVCHNTYLEIAANLGLLGLIPFLLILYKGFHILKNAIRDPNTSELAWGIRAGLLGSYVAILFLSVPFKLDFWILLALSAVLSRSCKQKNDL